VKRIGKLKLWLRKGMVLSHLFKELILFLLRVLDCDVLLSSKHLETPGDSKKNEKKSLRAWIFCL